jgi:hypothetical protein
MAALVSTFVAARPASAASGGGTKEGESTDGWVGWGVKWSYTDGTSSVCGPASGGDGWSCTTAVPNRIKYTAKSVSGNSGNVEQLWVNLQRNPDTNSGNPWQWVDSISQDCLGSNPSCYYPDNQAASYLNTTKWRTFDIWGGGGFWLGFGTHYTVGGGSTKTYTTGWIPVNDGLGSVARFMPYIAQANEIQNRAPVVTVGPPAGESFHRTHPLPTTLAFSMTAADPEGHNWFGQLQVCKPSNPTCTAPVYSTTFGGTKFASNTTATTEQMDFAPSENGTYTIRARATDTAGGSQTKTSAWTTATFSYTANLAPDVPSLIEPYGGASTLSDAHTQQFVVTSADPENDTWRADIDVQTAAGAGIVTDLPTSAGNPSGGTATASMASPLPAGSYRWRARAVDQVGSASAESAWESFRVVSAAAGTTFASDGCASGTPVVDGYLGDAYLRLRHAQPNPSTTDVCVRLDSGDVHEGGRVRVTTETPATPSGPEVTPDFSQSSCATARDTDPLPDPLLRVEDDPLNPGEFRWDDYFSFDVTKEKDRVGACLWSGILFPPVGATVWVPIPATPRGGSVDWTRDASTPHAPAPTPWPSGTLPSRACIGGTSHVNAAFEETHTWISSREATPTRTQLCLRSEGGGVNVGGVLTVDTSAFPGVTPVVTTAGSEDDQCPLELFDLFNPVRLRVATSGAGVNPASVCIGAGPSNPDDEVMTTVRVTAGSAGSLGVPVVTWQPDAGTPG